MGVSLMATLFIGLLVCQQTLGEEPTWYEFEGSLYFVGEVSPSAVSFYDVRSICQSHGGDLVFITSQEINDFLLGLTSNATYFIGLTDQETEGIFKWLDGSPLGYENWDVFEPNDHLGEDCVEMDTLERDGRWNDQSCDRKIEANSYICGMQSTLIIKLSYLERTNPGTARVSCSVTAFSSANALSSDEIRVSVGSALSSPVPVTSTSVEGNIRNNTYVINDLGENEEIFCSVYDMEKGMRITRRFPQPDHIQLPILSSYPSVLDLGTNFFTVAWTRWSTCSDSGEGPVIGYNIYIRPQNGAWAEAGHVNALSVGPQQSTFSFNVTHLEPDTDYSLSVSAIREDIGGEGPMGLIARTRTSSSEHCTPSSPAMTLQQREQPAVICQSLLSWTMFGVSGIGNITFLIVIIVLCLKLRQSHSKRETTETIPGVNPTFYRSKEEDEEEYASAE